MTPRSVRAALLVVALTGVANTSAAQPRPLGEVLVLTTGGTIASRATGPMTDGASLVRGIPELAKVATIRVEEVMRVPSSQIMPADWLRLAMTAEAKGQGVLVVLNEDISAARDVWKTDNRRADTFGSPQRGYLGAADPDTVVFFRRVLAPHTLASEFDIARVDSLSRVEIITDYAGFDTTIMQAAVQRHPRGIVLTSFAGGRLSAGGRAAVRIAATAGIPVVVASRVPGGRIVGAPLGDLPGILARDLPAHKARVLLMLALTRTGDRAALQQLFDRY